MTHRVLRQRQWTDEQLQQAGFQYFPPRKRLIMARTARHATQLKVTLETLRIDEGDVICYDPGDGTPHNSLDDFDHWPIQRDLFKKTYRAWDTPGWLPNPAEAQLMKHRCKPVYKWQGIWALRLPFSIYVQSLESPEPIVVPRGRWLCIGAEGEPYHMTDESLHARYITPEEV